MTDRSANQPEPNGTAPAHPDLPRLQSIGVPPPYQSHKLVAGKLFFTLPRGLLEAVVREVSPEAFDAGLLELEYALSEVCEKHPGNVGFWNGRPIQCQYLRPLEPFPADSFQETIQSWGMTVAHVEHCLRIGQGTLTWDSNIVGGYAGWLLASPTFLKEHDALFAEWKEEISEWGIPRAGLLVADRTRLEGMERIEDPKIVRFVDAFHDFCVRWRLNGLAAPYLPVPVEPQLSGDFPMTVLQQLRGVGGIFFVPDTFPIPSRDQLRQVLDDSLHAGGSPEHLREWMGFIRRDNSARNRISRFARLLEVQHYWKILHQRHATVLSRKGAVNRVHQAFAAFFDIGTKMLAGDLRLLRQRLGPKWPQSIR